MSNVPRMRTLPEAVAELKALDPDTALTLRAVRRMVNTGELPVTPIGNKRLINFDNLLERLRNPVQPAPEPLTTYGGIRPIY